MVSRRSHRRIRSFALLGGTLGAVMLLATTAAAVGLVKISEDPYTNQSSYHKTQVEPDTFAFGSTIVSTFQTGRFTDGGASNIGWATSTDGGTTWSHGFLPATTPYSTPPGPWARISDPAVAYDAEHGVWLINTLALNSSPDGKDVMVSRSTDGLSWGPPITVEPAGPFDFFDKNWITCDNWPSSPFYGNCYVQWDVFSQGNRLRMSRSTDGGLTWTDSTTPSSSVIGGQPLAQPSGKVVMPIDDGAAFSVLSFTSTNGGTSYQGPFPVSSIFSHDVAGNLRSLPLVSADVDASGKVYAVWHDCRFRTGCSANDIVLSTSTDGQSWTNVVRIPIAPTSSGADFFIPGIGVDHSTSGSSARVGIAFYFYPDASCSESTCTLGAGFIGSTDGGATWRAPVAAFGGMSLRSLPLTTSGYMVGDYFSTSWMNARPFSVLARATVGTTCTLGQITSCDEFMVAPSYTLGEGPARPAGQDRPVPGARSDHPRGGLKTAN